jgi:hypothetical protein
MPAADPKKIKALSDAVTAIKRKRTNVKLNLETGAFEVLDAKDAVVKTIVPKKGSDAIYIVNNTSNADDLKAAGVFLHDQREIFVGQAAEFEAGFAEKQEEMLKAVEQWRQADPGALAARCTLSIEIGRLQQELALLESNLRQSQYKYRGAVSVDGLKRRVFAPQSFDDRVVPYKVYKLNANQTTVALRIMPLK